MADMHAAMLMIVVAMLLRPSMGTGAFGTLYLVDQRGQPDEWDGQELFIVDDPVQGRNPFTMIASHASQYLFEVYAVWAGDGVDDVSDVYVVGQRSRRIMKFIGMVSYLVLMMKLLPFMLPGLLPWHEAVVQSNDYPGEAGCRVTVRSYMQPLLWWVRRGAETSITAGAAMFQNFKAIKLPRFMINNDFNYAAWQAYFQEAGPRYFVYMPHKTQDPMLNIKQMADDERAMGRDVDKKMLKRLIGMYRIPYAEGRWLDKEDRLWLSRQRKAML